MMIYSTLVLIFIQFGLTHSSTPTPPTENLVPCLTKGFFEVFPHKICKESPHCENENITTISLSVKCHKTKKICCQKIANIPDSVICPGTDIPLNKEPKCIEFNHGSVDSGRCDVEGRHTCFLGHCCPKISKFNGAFVTPEDNYYSNKSCNNDWNNLPIGSYCSNGKLVYAGLRDADGVVQDSFAGCKPNSKCSDDQKCARFYKSGEGVCVGKKRLVPVEPQVEEQEPTTADPLSSWEKTQIFLAKWKWQLVGCAIMCLLGFLAWLALYVKNRLVRHILTSPIDMRDLKPKGWETFGTVVSPPKDTEKDCFC